MKQKKSLLFILPVLCLMVAAIWWGNHSLYSPESTAEAKEKPAEVVSPDVPKAKYTSKGGIKTFKLTAEPVKQEVSKGIYMKAWGYNGGTPGPTIVVNQDDKIRVEIKNNLKEPTSVHWHGLIVPNKMYGVPAVEDSPKIMPGKSFTYEFKIKQAGTFMYHSHVNVEKQEMMGLGGMLVSLPKNNKQKIDRDYTLLTQEWKLEKPKSKMDMNMGTKDKSEGEVTQGTYEVNPKAMMWNVFTFNGKQMPDTTPLKVKKGERVKIRLGNLSMESHPIHMHGHNATVIAKDGVPLKKSAQYLVNTVNIAPGETYDIAFTADNTGTWPLHCHLPHHTAGKGQKEGGMFTTVKYLNK
ncbi:multicopper oxidase family protein [Fictibacillus enclensis]|uniref:multicopper oxidase family protein n=1 Tax=Fictibacillus enclensis TaxID=1017270 RepID=UPI0024C0292F|nr:copper oxidase [Fictibacillus enclensis]WHY70552.1 copper oxidase [Fictibacillus enclensis]